MRRKRPRACSVVQVSVRFRQTGRTSTGESCAAPDSVATRIDSRLGGFETIHQLTQNSARVGALVREGPPSHVRDFSQKDALASLRREASILTATEPGGIRLVPGPGGVDEACVTSARGEKSDAPRTSRHLSRPPTRPGRPLCKAFATSVVTALPPGAKTRATARGGLDQAAGTATGSQSTARRARAPAGGRSDPVVQPQPAVHEQKGDDAEGHVRTLHASDVRGSTGL